MRVAIFAAYYLPHLGGYCTNIHELAKRLVARGHSVVVVTCNTEQSKMEEDIDGVRVIRLPTVLHLGGTLPVPSMTSSKLALTVHFLRCDVAITQSRIFPTSILGALYAGMKKVPLVHVERGGCHTVLRSSMLSGFTRAYDHTIGAAIVRRAAKVVGISATSAAFIQHLEPDVFPVVIRNGVNIPTAALDRPKRNGVYKVIFTGRLIYAKGVQTLISALSGVAAQGRTVALTVVGDGNYRKPLEDIARDRLFPISFTGMVEPQDVYPLLATHDLFVNPSYSEGLPTTVTEAAAVGMPIVATDVGGTREVIDDGVNGILVPPHDVAFLRDRIEWMIDHPVEASRMGVAARETVSKLRWDNVTDQWENLLKSVIEGGR